MPSGGVAACTTAGGRVNAPNGVSNVWGNADPAPRFDRRIGVRAARATRCPTTACRWRRRSRSVASRSTGSSTRRFGNDVFNEGRHFSLGEFQTREQDQDGKTVETAKPIATLLAWRTTGEHARELRVLQRPACRTAVTVEDASYAKIREVNLAYNVGAVRGVGDWTVSVVGRNLYTFTRYTGFDPEVGKAGGQLGSGAINGIDAWQYPNVARSRCRSRRDSKCAARRVTAFIRRRRRSCLRWRRAAVFSRPTTTTRPDVAATLATPAGLQIGHRVAVPDDLVTNNGSSGRDSRPCDLSAAREHGVRELYAVKTCRCRCAASFLGWRSRMRAATHGVGGKLARLQRA